jgi:hypothetical protein
MLILLNNRKCTFAVLSVPIKNLIVKPTAQKVFAIMRKLYISDCFGVTVVRVGACLVFGDVEKMNFS